MVELRGLRGRVTEDEIRDVTGVPFIYDLESDCKELSFHSKCDGKSLEVLSEGTTRAHFDSNEFDSSSFSFKERLSGGRG